MMKVTLNLTHRCNFFCKYCYSGRKIVKDMSLATARKIVDFAIDTTSPEQRIGFGFAGGEPLLCFDLLTEIVEYIRKQERNTLRQDGDVMSGMFSKILIVRLLKSKVFDQEH